MKNFMVANLTKKKRYDTDAITTLIRAQIENSLNVGWSVKDIILLTNFEFEFMGVKSIVAELNNFCLTGSKMFGMKWLFDNNLIDDVIWAHDLDAWQNVSFECPEFKDVGAAYYSNPKYNGGSIFWRRSAKDIVNHIIKVLTADAANKEEPTINKLFKNKYAHRVTTLNNTFNVGCSGYAVRWERSIKPIHVCHFHPYNKTAWETHALDRNGLDDKGISDSLKNLLRKYYPDLATKLSSSGKKAQQERRERRLNGLAVKP